MDERYNVLIVEDNVALNGQISDFLSAKNMTPDHAFDGKMALNLVQQSRYDVIILDLNLPDTDGLVLCQQMKQVMDFTPPILMLTARDSLAEKLQGFEVGADDYLTKPFALAEVYARCMALCKRHQLHKAKSINIGDLSMDVNQRKVSRAGSEISLTSTDFTILKLLAEAFPNALSKRQICEKIWGDDVPDSDVLRSHIYTLRNAVDKPFPCAMIKTVHGIGFKLVACNE